MLSWLAPMLGISMRTLLLLLLSTALLPIQAQQRKVVIIGQPSELISELREASPANVTITHVTDRGIGDEKLLLEVADADAIIGNPPLAVVRAAKRLAWVQITSAGVKPYLYSELVESEVVMTNAQTLSSAAIADHGFAMLLALTRKLNHFITDRTNETWKGGNYGLEELEGKTALVIGTGGIGSNVARRAKAFGMKVIGVDPEEFPPRLSFDRMVYPDRLDQVIPEADAVFICAPHTRDSEGMMGPAQFERMKRGSYFIAVSPRESLRYVCVSQSARQPTHSGRGCRRHRSRAATERTSAVEIRQRDHHAARGNARVARVQAPYRALQGQHSPLWCR